MYCTKCGKEGSSADKFCAGCGTELNQQNIGIDPVATDNPSIQESSINDEVKNVWLKRIVGVFVGVIIIIICGLFLSALKEITGIGGGLYGVAVGFIYIASFGSVRLLYKKITLSKETQPSKYFNFCSSWKLIGIYFSIAALILFVILITNNYMNGEEGKSFPVAKDSISTERSSTDNQKDYKRTNIPDKIKNEYSGIEFVLVDGGCYQMGDSLGIGSPAERPVHEVCVDSFYISKYEVTQGQWAKVLGVDYNPTYIVQGSDYPVAVNWNDTQIFISLLNVAGGPYRLPTEAEWEYVARDAGKDLSHYTGDNLDSVAWYGKNSGGKTHRVGQKMPNSLGVYDIQGNVAEWVHDWFKAGYYAESPKMNPKGPLPGGLVTWRSFRGSSYLYPLENTRITSRGRNYSTYRTEGLGFRLVAPVEQ